MSRVLSVRGRSIRVRIYDVVAGDALVKVMDNTFETHMDQSVVNKAIDTLRTLSHSDGPTSVSGCNIRMGGDDWYVEKDEYDVDEDPRDGMHRDEYEG